MSCTAGWTQIVIKRFLSFAYDDVCFVLALDHSPWIFLHQSFIIYFIYFLSFMAKGSNCIYKWLVDTPFCLEVDDLYKTFQTRPKLSQNEPQSESQNVPNMSQNESRVSLKLSPKMSPEWVSKWVPKWVPKWVLNLVPKWVPKCPKTSPEWLYVLYDISVVVIYKNMHNTDWVGEMVVHQVRDVNGDFSVCLSLSLSLDISLSH